MAQPAAAAAVEAAEAAAATGPLFPSLVGAAEVWDFPAVEGLWRVEPPEAPWVVENEEEGAPPGLVVQFRP